MYIEELGGASVEADTLALVEFAFPVIARDALLLARLRKTVHHLGQELHLGLDSSDLLRRRRLGPSKSEKRHIDRVSLCRIVILRSEERRVGKECRN